VSGGLTAFLDEGVERGVFAGASAIVAEPSGIIFEAHRGLARAEPEGARAEAAADTLWDLASLTKPIAGAALVLALAEQNLLSLDDEVSRFEDAWKRTTFEGVTVRRLLTHSAGLVDWFPLYVKGEGRKAYRKALADLHLEARPGTRVTYSCPGFLMLCEVVERSAGAPLDSFFEERVSGPLGVSSDLLFTPERDDAARAAGGERDDMTERKKVADLGLSYGGFRSGVVNGEVNDGNAYRRAGGVALNAGLFGTARAVAEVGLAWLKRDSRLLNESSMASAVKNATPDLGEARGLGWALAESVRSAGDEIARASFGHTGFTGSSLFVDPSAHRVYVLLANRLHPDARSAEDMIAFRRRFHDTASRL
jgi:CubicO group peptidase (beta-lactamase class C family)